VPVSAQAIHPRNCTSLHISFDTVRFRMDPPSHTTTYGAVPTITPSHSVSTLGDFVAPLVAEFVGTFMLVFTVGVCNFTGSVIWNAAAIGATYAVLIYVFGSVSGGHFNPAVSLANGLVKHTSWGKVCLYIVVQIGAGVCAGWAYYEVIGQAAPVGPPMGYAWLYAAFVELMYTALLCAVALFCVASASNNPSDDQNCYYGAAIGFVLIGGGYAAGSISGAFFNPALSIGLDFFGKAESGPSEWWRVCYIVSQFGGSCLAALFYKALPPAPERADPAAERGGYYLHVRILAALSLRNKDSGVLGDVSDPYVTLRFGLIQERTPTVSNDMNPRWTHDNEFTFNLIQGGPTQVVLEVMNDNSFFKDQGLGTAVVNLQDLVPGDWVRQRQTLLDGQGGEIAYEAKVELPPVINVQGQLSTQLLREFLGTFAFVATVGLCIITKSPATGLAAAVTYTSMLYTLGNASSGYFNPVIVVALLFSSRGKFSAQFGLALIVMQMGAGILAGLFYSIFQIVGPYANEVFGLAPGASVLNNGTTYPWKTVFGAEFIFTFLLAYVVLSVACTTPPPADTKHNFHCAIAVGSCVMAGFYAANAISGGELNPALCFGISSASWAFSGGNLVPPPWHYCLIFSAFELAAGVAAAIVFRFTHGQEYVKPEALRV